MRKTHKIIVFMWRWCPWQASRDLLWSVRLLNVRGGWESFWKHFPNVLVKTISNSYFRKGCGDWPENHVQPTEHAKHTEMLRLQRIWEKQTQLSSYKLQEQTPRGLPGRQSAFQACASTSSCPSRTKWLNHSRAQLRGQHGAQRCCPVPSLLQMWVLGEAEPSLNGWCIPRDDRASYRQKLPLCTND